MLGYLTHWTNANTDAAYLLPVFELKLFAHFNVMRVTPEFVHDSVTLEGSRRTRPNALVAAFAKVQVQGLVSR